MYEDHVRASVSARQGEWELAVAVWRLCSSVLCPGIKRSADNDKKKGRGLCCLKGEASCPVPAAGGAKWGATQALA